MSLPVSFEAASKIVEGWPEMLKCAYQASEKGNWALAYVHLNELYKGLFATCETIREAADQLVLVSDRVLTHHGLAGSKSYNSAHEAVADVAFQVYVGLMLPLEGIKDGREWEVTAKHLLAKLGYLMSLDASLMETLIRRERAKVLMQLNEASSSSDSEVFVPIGKLWHEQFSTYRKAKLFLDKHKEIRTRKPSASRLEVHAADWIKYWSGQQSAPTDAQIEEYLEEIEQRKMNVQRRK